MAQKAKISLSSGMTARFRDDGCNDELQCIWKCPISVFAAYFISVSGSMKSRFHCAKRAPDDRRVLPFNIFMNVYIQLNNSNSFLNSNQNFFSPAINSFLVFRFRRNVSACCVWIMHFAKRQKKPRDICWLF